MLRRISVALVAALSVTASAAFANGETLTGVGLVPGDQPAPLRVLCGLTWTHDGGGSGEFDETVAPETSTGFSSSISGTSFVNVWNPSQFSVNVTTLSPSPSANLGAYADAVSTFNGSAHAVLLITGLKTVGADSYGGGTGTGQYSTETLRFAKFGGDVEVIPANAVFGHSGSYTATANGGTHRP